MTNARLVLSISQTGTVWLGYVSLFPRATFNNPSNGLRADLANLLAANHPSFLRYPGGNFIESYNVTNAVRWKKTMGDLALRPGHLNDSWGYWSTDGLGLHEFLQYCEDMGMEPLYGINCGLMLGYNGSTNNTVALSDMGPWVQDALDLIEYANGDTNWASYTITLRARKVSGSGGFLILFNWLDDNNWTWWNIGERPAAHPLRRLARLAGPLLANGSFFGLVYP